MGSRACWLVLMCWYWFTHSEVLYEFDPFKGVEVYHEQTHGYGAFFMNTSLPLPLTKATVGLRVAWYDKGLTPRIEFVTFPSLWYNWVIMEIHGYVYWSITPYSCKEKGQHVHNGTIL